MNKVIWKGLEIFDLLRETLMILYGMKLFVKKLIYYLNSFCDTSEGFTAVLVVTSGKPILSLFSNYS